MPPTPSERADEPATPSAGRSVEEPGNQTAAYLPALGELTYDELHAAYLGTMGVLVGLTYAAGNVEEAIGFSLTAIGVAVGIRVLPEELDAPGADRYRHDPRPAVALLTFVPWVLDTAAARTVRREPAYFVAVYLVMFLAGTGLAAVLARSV